MAEKKQPEQKEEPGKSHIPTFNTIEEEAAFWDTHSIEEFADELELVTDVKFVKARQKKSLTVRLEENSFEALSSEARERGIGPSTLARIVLLEHLQNREQKKRASG
ncbi:MAG TPA: CopG family antitoxin [Ktedonobacterales bacterium]|jgi:predicted DNA binding CopG/RHH family protein